MSDTSVQSKRTHFMACSLCQNVFPGNYPFLTERFSYDLEIITREHSREINKRTRTDQFDWCSERK